MADAVLGLEIRSDKAVTAGKALDDLTASAGRAEAAAKSLSATDQALATSMDALMQAVKANTGALTTQTAALGQINTANTQASATTQRLTREEDALAASAKRAAAAQAQVAQATMQHNAAIAKGWQGMSAMGKANLSAVDFNKRFIAGMSQAGKQAEQTSVQVEKLSRTQRLMFQSAAFRGFESFAAGAPITTIGMQQIPELIDAAAMGEKGLTGTLKTLGGIFTTTRLVTAGIVGLGAAAVVAFARWQAAQDRAAASLGRLGMTTGLTLRGLNEVATQGAARGGISGAQGLQLAGTFAGAGIEGSGTIRDMVSMAKDFARVMGTDMQTAGEQMAGMFKDPVKGAEELQKSLGGVSFAQRELIEQMVRSGDVMGAQAELAKLLDARLKMVDDRTWGLIKTWKTFGQAVSDAADAAGSAINRLFDPMRQIQLLQDKITAEERDPIWNATSLAKDRARLAELQKSVAEDQARTTANAIKLRRDEASQAAGAAVRTAVPEFGRAQGLSDDIENLKKNLLIIGPELRERLGPAYDLVTEAIKRMEAASASLRDEQGRVLTQADLATEKFNIEIATIRARTEADREAIAVSKIVAESRGQSIDIEIAKERELQKVREQAKKDAEDTLKTAKEAAAGAGMLAFPQKMLDITTKYNDLREKGGAPAKAALDAAEAIEKQAAALNAVIAPIREANVAVDEQIQKLQIQRDTFGHTTGEIETANEHLKLYNQYLQQGIDPLKTMIDEHTTLADAIQKEAERYGQAQQAAEDLAKAQAEVKRTVDLVTNSFSDMVDVIANDVMGGKTKNIGKDLVKALGMDLVKASTDQLKQNFNDLVSKPLTQLVSKATGADKFALPGTLGILGMGALGSSVNNPMFVKIVGGAGGGLGDLIGGSEGKDLLGGAGADLLQDGGGGASSNLSPTERDLMIRTLAGEAGGESELGQIAVASVIKNRLAAAPGKSLTDIIKAPNQFSTWNAGDPAGDLARSLDATGSQYKQLGTIVDAVMAGRIADPTGGARFFYNPKTSSPSWGSAPGFMIGAHRFIGGARAPAPVDLSAVQPNWNAAWPGSLDAARSFLQSRYVGWDKSGSPITGMNSDFAMRLAAMEQARPGITQFSGYRSPELQAQLYRNAIAKYGSPEAARKWVAPPGTSQHNFGMAADLRFGSPDDVAWAHAHAQEYGLEFPMSWEKWHIQPMKNWQGRGIAGQQPLSDSVSKAAEATQSLADSSKQLAATATPAATATDKVAGGFKDLGSTISSSLGGIGSLIGGAAGGGKGAILGGGIGSILGIFAKAFGFAEGGVSNKPAIFGEAGAEAAVPLPDGRSIPVTLRGKVPSGLSRPAGPAYSTGHGGAPITVSPIMHMRVDLSGANGDAAIAAASEAAARRGAMAAYQQVYKDLPRRLQAAQAEGRTRY